jgi:carbamoyltransferase
MKYFDFLRGNHMYSAHLPELLGLPPRTPDSEIRQCHMDLARSLQVVLEAILLDKAGYLYQRTGMRQLCMAGGVALNCVANGRLLRQGPFRRMFVQPASNDAGGALGAAALAHVKLTGERPAPKRLEHVYLGPAYSGKQIGDLLEAAKLKSVDCRGNEPVLLAEVSRRLAAGKVIGWFQGRMEFGPRSLGGRSILADPRDVTMRDRINSMVKKREGFRPFAPAVLHDRASEHFALDHESPFMLETCQVISPLDLPAITHVDGSARVQTVSPGTHPRFAALLEAFDRLTGCPILLNTSFNVKGEPIVCSPEDALLCFINTDIDCLVLEDYIIDRYENFPPEEGRLQLLNELLPQQQRRQMISHDVYTFI